MNIFEEIDMKKEELEHAYMVLIRDSHFAYAQELSYVYQYYSTLYAYIRKIYENLAERQRLVELHFLNVPIPLSVHEQYHEVSNQLEIQVKDFFTACKTMLNAFTRLIGKVIPKEERSAASVNSFGSFLYDCQRKQRPSNPLVNKLFDLFANDGIIINDTINYYRNNFIEHSKTLSFGSLSTTPSSVTIIHQDGILAPSLLIRSPEQNFTANHTFLDDIIVFTANDDRTTAAYVHLYRPENMPNEVTQNTLLGYNVDHTGVHFAKYGPHLHFFPPEKRRFPIMVSPGKRHLTDSNVIQESPEVFSSMVEITLFTTTLFTLLKEYVNS